MKDNYPMRRAGAGLTLIEMLVTLAVLIVLTATAIPLVSKMREKQRITAATEAVTAQITLAKSESAKRSADIYVAIHTGSDWAVGVSETSGCDPEGTDCILKYYESDGSSVNRVHTRDSSDYPGTTIENSSPSEISIDPVRGTMTQGTVKITSDDYEIDIKTSTFGRVRICSPSGTTKVGRYPDC
jgi:type IV fimbrial biogenesis protein FimT